MGEMVYRMVRFAEVNPFLQEAGWLLQNLPNSPSMGGLEEMPPLRAKALLRLVSIGFANCRFDVIFRQSAAADGDPPIATFEFIGQGDTDHLFYDISDHCRRLVGIDLNDASVLGHAGENICKFGLTSLGDSAKRSLRPDGDFIGALNQVEDSPVLKATFYRVRSTASQQNGTAHSSPGAPRAEATAQATASVGDINVNVAAPDFGPLAEILGSALKGLASGRADLGETLPKDHIAVSVDTLDSEDWSVLETLLDRGPMNQDTLHDAVHNVQTGKTRPFSGRLANLAKLTLIESTTGRSAVTSITENGRKALRIKGSK